MKIRDIIEKWHRIATNYAQHGYTAAVHARDFEEMRDDFASALEELALMEAERDALLAEHDPSDFHAIGVRVMCNDHYLFTVRTLDDATDAIEEPWRK